MSRFRMFEPILRVQSTKNRRKAHLSGNIITYMEMEFYKERMQFTQWGMQFTQVVLNFKPDHDTLRI